VQIDINHRIEICCLLDVLYKRMVVVMGNIFRYYLLLAKRWLWLLVVCVLVSGGATYLISTFLRPIYQATAYVLIDVGASTHPSVTESLQAVPTFAQLITIPAVLDPVAEQHPGLSAQDLLAAISVRPQTNTQIIELSVQAAQPKLAADLANQVSQSFAQYVNASAPGTVSFIPATVPSFPMQPRPLQDAAAGALVGFILALLLATLFEWGGNRPTSVEQIQELLGMEILTLVPRLSRQARRTEIPLASSEKYQMICASLNVAQLSRPFKLVMFTSALAGEGKSTLVSSVAIHLAQAGKRVLLVDLNVHRPVIAQRFHLKSQPGLTDLLARHLPLEQYSQATAFAGLHVLAAGTCPMSSLEFLRSLTAAQFFTRLQQAPFDYVLLDTPPLFAVAETQILASSVEALVLVVNGSQTPQRVLARTRQLLWRMQSTRILGVVVNQSSWRDYGDTHPYTLTSPGLKLDPQMRIEEVTLELPAVPTRRFLIPEPAPAQVRLPNTGETVQVSKASSERIIRPPISLSSLTMSTNGLLGRTFEAGTATPVPPSLRDSGERMSNEIL
jgi:capsular exopolysaccharide synthesis family protein